MNDGTYSISVRSLAEATGNAPDIARNLLDGFATRMDGKTDCAYYSDTRIRSTTAVLDATRTVMDCIENADGLQPVELAYRIIDRLLDRGMLLPASPIAEPQPNMRDARAALIRNDIRAWDEGNGNIRFRIGEDDYIAPIPFDPRKSADRLADSVKRAAGIPDSYEKIADEGTFERFPHPEWDYLYATGLPVVIGIGVIDGFSFAVMSDGGWCNEARKAHGSNIESLKDYAEGLAQ